MARSGFFMGGVAKGFGDYQQRATDRTIAEAKADQVRSEALAAKVANVEKIAEQLTKGAVDAITRAPQEPKPGWKQEVTQNVRSELEQLVAPLAKFPGYEDRGRTILQAFDLNTQNLQTSSEANVSKELSTAEGKRKAIEADIRYLREQQEAGQPAPPAAPVPGASAAVPAPQAGDVTGQPPVAAPSIGDATAAPLAATADPTAPVTTAQATVPPSAQAPAQQAGPTDQQLLQKGLFGIAPEQPEKLSPEQAPRVAALQSAEVGLLKPVSDAPGAPTIAEFMAKPSEWDISQVAAERAGLGSLGVGPEFQMAQNAFVNAIAQVLYNLSGAQINPTEDARLTEIYIPNRFNDDQVAKRKVNNLFDFIARAKNTMSSRRLDETMTVEDALSLAYAAGDGQENGGKEAGPTEGTVEDGYRFKGGNPGDPNSWEKVN